MDNNNDKDGIGVMIKLPHEHLKFVERNPKIANNIAQMLCSIAGMNHTIKRVRNLLADPEMFSKDLEKGTEKELLEFLIAVQEMDDPEIQTGLTMENIEAMKEKYKDKISITRVEHPNKSKNEDGTLN